VAVCSHRFWEGCGGSFKFRKSKLKRQKLRKNGGRVGQQFCCFQFNYLSNVDIVFFGFAFGAFFAFHIVTFRFYIFVYFSFQATWR
jgi:hypothetical protein